MYTLTAPHPLPRAPLPLTRLLRWFALGAFFVSMRCCTCEDNTVDNDGDGAPASGACVLEYFRDCNDDDPTIHPDAPDPYGDGIDQNCDGVDGDRSGDGPIGAVDAAVDSSVDANVSRDAATDALGD